MFTATVECPRSFFTVTRSAPFRGSLEAKVWRNVCRVQLGLKLLH
jgi:hypothetical protein